MNVIVKEGAAKHYALLLQRRDWMTDRINTKPIQSDPSERDALTWALDHPALQRAAGVPYTGENEEAAQRHAEELFALIAHGDDEHRAWLRAKAYEFLNVGAPS